jgi:prevent-host-death family protein
MKWQLQEAMNRFGEVVHRARNEGPQVVTFRGERAAVVLSAKTYEDLIAKRPSLVDFLLSGPVRPKELAVAVNTHSKTPSRG